MRLRIFIEPQQGASYAEQLELAQLTERLGFDAFFRSDHFLTMRGPGLPGPTDAWTTLAGLARETRTVRLGTLVTSATFRFPGVLAVQVAQVDEMSAGRVEFGLGTGWFEAEHRTLGVPFPTHRFGMLEEQLEIVTGLWSTPVGERFTHRGRHYEVVDSPALPKPVQERIPVIVGGGGAQRTPSLAARYATEFNLPFPGDLNVRHAFDRVDAACEAIGRDPATMGHSLALVTLIGSDEQDFRRRAAASGREAGELRSGSAIAGTPAEALDRLARAAEEGASTVYLQLQDLRDLEHVELLAEHLLEPSRML